MARTGKAAVVMEQEPLDEPMRDVCQIPSCVGDSAGTVVLTINGFPPKRIRICADDADALGRVIATPRRRPGIDLHDLQGPHHEEEHSVLSDGNWVVPVVGLVIVAFLLFAFFVR